MRVALLMSDLNPLFNKVATFSTVESGEITGKVLAVSKDGVVVRARGNPRIVLIDDIIQYKEIVRPRRKRVIRRVVRRIEPTSEAIKQHLADRHALFVDLCNAISVEDAHKVHDAINHTNLGHYHREPDEALAELDDAGNPQEPADEYDE